MSETINRARAFMVKEWPVLAANNGTINTIAAFVDAETASLSKRLAEAEHVIRHCWQMFRRDPGTESYRIISEYRTKHEALAEGREVDDETH